jgi:hypothetical protein
MVESGKVLLRILKNPGLSLFCLILFSCDPPAYSIYAFANESSYPVIVYTYGDGMNRNFDVTYIRSREKREIFRANRTGEGPPPDARIMLIEVYSLDENNLPKEQIAREEIMNAGKGTREKWIRQPLPGTVPFGGTNYEWIFRFSGE